MVVLEALSLASLLVALSTKKTLESKPNSDGSVTIIDKDTGKTVTTIPSFRSESYSFLSFIPKRLTGLGSIKPSEATLKIENPQERDLFLTKLSFIPDPTNFKTKGILEVKANGIAILEETDAGLFTDVDVLNVPIPPNGLTLRKQESIEVRAWSTDGTGSVTVGIALGAYKTK